MNLKKTLSHHEFLKLKFKHKRRGKSKVNYQDIFSKWLRGYNFNTFATFTTARELSLAGARRMAEKFGKHIRAGENSTFFWASEPFDVREGYHFHGLINTHGYISNYDMYKYWSIDKFFGRSEFVDIYRKFETKDSEKAIESYISKYVTKKLSDFDLYTSTSYFCRTGIRNTGPPERPEFVKPFELN